MTLLFLILVLGLVAVWVIALTQISKAGLDPTAKAVWVLIVVVAPFLGSILWWLIGEPSATPPFPSSGSLK